MQGTATETKEDRVRNEINRLNAIFADVPANKRNFCREHIKQLAWYEITCADLMASIDQIGTSIGYQNGANQKGKQANPDATLLVQFQKHINSISKVLLEIVPDHTLASGKFSNFLAAETESEMM